ncbi:histidine phosphotransferase [Epibacterium sp. SM1969]|uniref:Histidine phosphotransferase n=1 Tax=Tritonibacter aquimaris TaxID=2663379 RepID=A0A844AJG3_9RHOB|nr:histidine phosphotransferase family protein [Tritonibacter aquimaris]MQY41440.1 histidine phosphotransferase [Tritonibacter aquimaris]
MAVDNVNLATLIGSRICHDLISPVGAINNGLELLGMAGAVDGPELELISDSVGNANARIRFFRIAFGAAGEQSLGKAEVVSVLDDLSKGGRLKYHWQVEDAVSRVEVRLVFLAALCLESALPYGGEVTMQKSGDSWRVSGTGRKINVDADLWTWLSADEAVAKITPAFVQFALLPELAKETGRSVAFSQSETDVSITL